MITEGEGRFWVVATVMLMIGLLGLISLLPTAPTTRVGQQAPDQIAEKRAILAKCESAKPCIGGFVKRTNGIIDIIARCGNLNCSSKEIDIIRLLDSSRSGVGLHQFADIVLPDDQTWPTMAVEYARQFVEKK